MITIQGKGVSAGVGVGPLYFYRRATAEIKRYTVEDTDAEWHRFKGAQTGAIEQLGVLAEQARKEAGDEAAMLFETHQMMAEDLDYEEAIEDRILNQKMNAEAAVSDTAEQFADMFKKIADAQKLPLVPFLLTGIGDAADAAQWFQSDRIHPNAKAQPQMLGNVWLKLNPMLK